MSESLPKNIGQRERIEIVDGVALRIRSVMPGDQSIIAQGFKHLSPASRYQRFFRSKSELTQSELAYFTDIDDIHHVAIGIGVVGEDDRETEGVGVARFIRFQQDMRQAEFAITVVDGWQNKGIGTLLLNELISVAKIKGVETLYGFVLNDNIAMRRLIKKVAANAIFRHEGPVLEAIIPLVDGKRDKLIKRKKRMPHLLRGIPGKKRLSSFRSHP